MEHSLLEQRGKLVVMRDTLQGWPGEGGGLEGRGSPENLLLGAQKHLKARKSE